MQLPGGEELVIGERHRPWIADNHADLRPERCPARRKLREFLADGGDDDVNALLDDEPAERRDKVRVRCGRDREDPEGCPGGKLANVGAEDGNAAVLQLGGDGAARGPARAGDQDAGLHSFSISVLSRRTGS